MLTAGGKIQPSRPKGDTTRDEVFNIKTTYEGASSIAEQTYKGTSSATPIIAYNQWETKSKKQKEKTKLLMNKQTKFILRCRREISKNLRVTREINALCARLTAIVDEKEAFADELNMLAARSMLGKMDEFMKQV
nr:hypothetical protein [Tanacetum cinerariifolium]